MINVDSSKRFEISLPQKSFFADRLSYALDFARRTIQHLIVEGHSAPKDASWYVQSEKIIAEAAFLLVFAKAGDSNIEVKKATDALIKLLEPLSRSKSTLINICLKPALALDFAHAHICLSYLGFPNKQFDDVIEKVLSEKKMIERRPYRMLEQEWLLEIWPHSNNNKKIDFWTKLSILNHSINLFSESSDSAYSLTHAVLYSFFNNAKIKHVDLKKITNELEGLLVIYMDKQDYDVAGELLLAWSLTQEPFSHLAIFALKCLIKIEKEVGFLPAPNLDTSMIEGREQTERRTYIFSINYHTAFVMGLLSGSMLKNFDKISILPNQAVDSPQLKELLRAELLIGKNAHWIEYYNALDNKQKDDLLPWVYQTILARKINQHKYGSVKKIIDLTEGSCLENLFITKQAKELLNRLSLIQ